LHHDPFPQLRSVTRRPTAPRHGRCQTPCRPPAEQLEGRCLLSSTDFWTGLGNPKHNDPNWSNPCNWSGMQVPAAGDTVVFTRRAEIGVLDQV
jgi:hypothetical protein